MNGCGQFLWDTNTMDERFYRQLFLRRYALLLEKAEHTFKIPKETMDLLRSRILTLDWVDVGVRKLPF